MYRKILPGVVWCVALLAGKEAGAQSVSLNSKEPFRDAGRNWVIAGNAWADYTKPQHIAVEKGQGVIVNTMSKKDQTHLVTKEEFEDSEVELEFMMAKNSNSGVYLQGRYEIQLLDSWKNTNPSSADAGGVYQRYAEDEGRGFEGTAPLMSVARAPGLWQKLKIRFKAPRFDAQGKKTENARFEEVYLNGVLVQEGVSVSGPTRAALYQDEQKKGPLMIQGDHGPVAIRNLSIRSADVARHRPKEWYQGWELKIHPIFYRDVHQPTFIKTFLDYGDKKLTHVLSAGHPTKINYSYDLKQGAIFQVWRGDFMDVTKAWYGRGDSQLGTPMGSLLTFSDAPPVAVLGQPDQSWPDSVGFYEMNNKGYVLNKERSPVFQYEFGGLKVRDSIVTLAGGEGLERSLIVENTPANTYVRVARGKDLSQLSNGLYQVNDRTYYISLDKKYQPVIRNSAGEQELLVKYNGTPVTYSIIW